MAYAINISDAELQKSAVTYRKDLLVMPVIAAEATLQHMTPRPGVAGREVLGQLSGGIELGPYDPQRYDDDGLDIKPRTLETYLGSVIKRFDLNSVAKTVYGSLTTQGEALTSLDLARQVLNYLSMQLGRNLNLHIWNAKRNETGKKTADLFDGFDTITDKEKSTGNIATGKGNYMKLTEAITNANAVDVAKQILFSLDPRLRSQKCYLFCSQDFADKYNEAYLLSHGGVSYNNQYTQTFVEGSNGMLEIVPLYNKADSKYFHIAPKANMLVGYDQMGDMESVSVEQYEPFVLSYIATMFFGVQFESLDKRRLKVVELAG